VSDKDEDTITRKDLLQINATLITGIIIFLAVFSQIGLQIITFNADLINNIFYYLAIVCFIVAFLLFTLSVTITIERSVDIHKAILLLVAGLFSSLYAITLILTGLYGSFVSIILLISLSILIFNRYKTKFFRFMK
jgi:hypothetical protein